MLMMRVGAFTLFWMPVFQGEDSPVRFAGAFETYMDLAYPPKEDIVLTRVQAEVYMVANITKLLILCGLTGIGEA